MLAAILLATMIWLIARQGRPIPPEAAWLLRVFTALSGAGLAASASGMLSVDLNLPRFALKATSGFAVFVLLYLCNPPGRHNSSKIAQDGQTQTVESEAKGAQIQGNNNRVDQ